MTPVYSAPQTYTVSTPTPYYPTTPSYPTYPSYPTTPTYPPYNPPVVTVPTCTLTASPTTVQHNGTATLQWSAHNATAATLSGFGSVATAGTRTVTGVTGTRVYTLTVSGQGGVATCSATIYTQQQQAPTCTAYASPNSVQQGGSTTVTWNSTNATYATLTDAGAVAVQGSRTFTNLNSTRTYTVTVTGPGGTNTCTATVGVYSTPVPPPVTQQPSCTLSASPTTLAYGQYTTLSWNAYNATSASINTIGAVGLNGSRAVMPNGTMTYVMTVYGQGGMNTCSTTVYTQTQPPVIVPPVIVPPVVVPPQTGLYCTLTANPRTIQNGQSALLSWTSYGATTAWLNDGLGMVGPNGTLTVRPESSRAYTLTIRDAYGNQTTCQTTLTVSRTAPYVSLSAIPYTGVDLGVFGSLAYWAALMLFAAAAAYVTVGYRGGIVGAVYGLMDTFNAPMRRIPDAVILDEVIVAREESDTAVMNTTANEDIVADAVSTRTRTSDTMTLEHDGDMPRITLRRA